MSESRLTEQDLMEAGLAYVAFAEGLTEVVDDDPGALTELGGWAALWGERLLDEVDRLRTELKAAPRKGERDLLRVYVDCQGLLQATIDAPRQEENAQGGIADEAHFAAVYEVLSRGHELLGNLVKHMKGHAQ